MLWYKAILETANDKNGYIENSSGLLNALTENTLADTEECPFCGSSGDDIIPYYYSPQVMKLENRQAFPPVKLWMKCTHCYHVEAVEICREDCERISQALGVNIKWCDIIDYETEKQFDVIVMGDVLEHVLDPVQVLEKAKRMLSEDGILWISTPNYHCAYARMQKFSHCMWHELNHYTYVSYETLNQLLKDMQMEVVHYDMGSRYIGSMELFIKQV